MENAVQSDVVKHFSIVIGEKFLIVDRSETNNGPITTSQSSTHKHLSAEDGCETHTALGIHSCTTLYSRRVTYSDFSMSQMIGMPPCTFLQTENSHKRPRGILPREENTPFVLAHAQKITNVFFPVLRRWRRRASSYRPRPRPRRTRTWRLHSPRREPRRVA